MIKYDLQFFGGRGASGTLKNSNGKLVSEKIPYGGRGMNLSKFLSDDDIRHANNASVTDMGDIIKRMFVSGAKEIDKMEFSDSEKKEYITELANKATTALKASAGAVNPFASGRSRLTTAQKTGSAADRAASARGSMDSYMKFLRDKAAKNTKERKNAELASVLRQAQAEGKMEITIDGKRYYRKSKRGSWYA